MQTQTHRADACTPAVLQAAVKKALTSAAFGQFMTGVVLNAVAEASAAPQGIGLPPLPKPSRVSWYEANGFRSYTAENADETHEFSMQVERDDPRGLWYGNETRVDETGRRWIATLGKRVMNDFGDLVEVRK